MKLSLFDYYLPEELIAQTPIDKRDDSRLLLLNPENQSINESKFYEILDFLWKNDVLILNETRVINARLKGKIEIYPNNSKKKQIKEIEILLHKQISLDTRECLGPWNNLNIWRIIYFYDKNWELVLEWKVEKISKMWRFIRFKPITFSSSWLGGGWEGVKERIEKTTFSSQLYKIIEQIWEIPLPPYITTDLEDKERYQTVYAKTKWSAAAPTAWLHFTKELIEKLEKKWVQIEKVLLHVWVWTFKPVEVENIEKHYMHSEYIEICETTAKKLNKYKKQWKRIIAVWTTCVRVLESFSDKNWIISSWIKETDIFIYPWYEWKFVDSLITNFHLPKSTLLMLVSSFAWREFILKAYDYAIKNNFRFFSFWDAMWIEKSLQIKTNVNLVR